MPIYKAVIFDFDDTLFESRAQKWAQHVHVAKKFYDIDLTEETLREHWGKPIHIMAPIYYGHKDTWENIHENLRATRADFPKKIYPDTKETLQKIFSSGIKVGVLSSASNFDIETDLIAIGFLPENFVALQGVEATPVHKPHPDVFLPIFEKLHKEGIEKDSILYVGDSLTDLESAYSAGIDFIAVTTGLYSEEDFKKEGAKVVISSIKDLVSKIL